MMNKTKILLLTAFLMVSPLSHAADSTDLAAMFANTESATSSFMILINGIALLAGILFSGGALFKLKAMSDSGFQHGNGKSNGIMNPILMLIAGVCCIQFVFSMQTMQETLGATGQLFSLSSETHTSSGEETFEKAINALLLLVKLIGIIANIKAFFNLYTAGRYDLQMEWGKQFWVLIIAGTCAIHIEWFVGIVLTTFGISTDFLQFG